MSDQVAKDIFGTDWASLIDIIPDYTFVNYSVGSPIVNANNYDPVREKAISKLPGSDYPQYQIEKRKEGETIKVLTEGVSAVIEKSKIDNLINVIGSNFNTSIEASVNKSEKKERKRLFRFSMDNPIIWLICSILLIFILKQFVSKSNEIDPANSSVPLQSISLPNPCGDIPTPEKQSDKLNINIHYPQEGSLIGYPTKVCGNLDGVIQQGKFLWIINRLKWEVGPDRWWPNQPITEIHDGQWMKEGIYIGDEINWEQTFVLAVVVVDQSYNTRFESYLRNSEKTKSYPSEFIPELARGDESDSISILDDVTVVREKIDKKIFNKTQSNSRDWFSMDNPGIYIVVSVVVLLISAYFYKKLKLKF